MDKREMGGSLLDGSSGGVQDNKWEDECELTLKSRGLSLDETSKLMKLSYFLRCVPRHSRWVLLVGDCIADMVSM